MEATSVLTPTEIRRSGFRMRLFESHGWDEQRAKAWALRLVLRDMAHDDRRLCVECRHLTSKWECVKGEAVVAELLQRCPKFEWEKP